MSLATVNTSYLKGSYTNDLVFLLQMGENAPLAVSADPKDPALLPHIDGSHNLAIGYGYDFAANGTAQSIADLKAAGAVIKDEAKLKTALDSLHGVMGSHESWGQALHFTPPPAVHNAPLT